MLFCFKFETFKLIFPTLHSFWKIWKIEVSIIKSEVVLIEPVVINFFNFILYKLSLLVVCFVLFLSLMNVI